MCSKTIHIYTCRLNSWTQSNSSLPTGLHAGRCLLHSLFRSSISCIADRGTAHRMRILSVQPSISKRKSRTTTLRRSAIGPVSPSEDLYQRIARVPGMEEHAKTLTELCSSWRSLGDLRHHDFLAKCRELPQKKVAEDTWDRRKLGIGHMQSIDNLRRRAAREAERREKLDRAGVLGGLHTCTRLFPRPTEASRSWTRCPQSLL